MMFLPCLREANLHIFVTSFLHVPPSCQNRKPSCGFSLEKRLQRLFPFWEPEIFSGLCGLTVSVKCFCPSQSHYLHGWVWAPSSHSCSISLTVTTAGWDYTMSWQAASPLTLSAPPHPAPVLAWPYWHHEIMVRLPRQALERDSAIGCGVLGVVKPKCRVCVTPWGDELAASAAAFYSQWAHSSEYICNPAHATFRSSPSPSTGDFSSP